MALTHETYPSTAGPIPIDIYMPGATGKPAMVLVLHGTLGLEGSVGADIASFAEGLNKAGIAAAIPSYFKSTNTRAGDEALQTLFTHLPAWKAACEAALVFLLRDARVDATRAGLLGFSLGGHIALALAMSPPPGRQIKGVVNFFAPVLQPPLRGAFSSLPPTQIHHGTADPLSIENSRHLVRKLEEGGRTVTHITFGQAPTGPVADDQFISYPGEAHGFKGAALAGSRGSTIEFLGKRLK